MRKSHLLDEIERLRAEMVQCSLDASCGSNDILGLSERLDRLINAYLKNGGGCSGLRTGGGAGGAFKKGLRLSRRRFKI